MVGNFCNLKNLVLVLQVSFENIALRIVYREGLFISNKYAVDNCLYSKYI